MATEVCCASQYAYDCRFYYEFRSDQLWGIEIFTHYRSGLRMGHHHEFDVEQLVHTARSLPTEIYLYSVARAWLLCRVEGLDEATPNYQAPPQPSPCLSSSLS